MNKPIYTWSPDEPFYLRKPVKAKFYWLKKIGKVILPIAMVAIVIVTFCFIYLLAAADYAEMHGF